MKFYTIYIHTCTYFSIYCKDMLKSQIKYKAHTNTQLPTSWHSLIVGPSSADSANSVQGVFSRVQKANGIAQASW